jgi:hypothetical protein
VTTGQKDLSDLTRHSRSSPLGYRPAKNGIFTKLAVVGFCLAASSTASLLLSYAGGRLQSYRGSPSDEAILYCFLYGLALAQIINLFTPAGSLRALCSLHFATVFLRSLVFAIPCWLIVAWGGSELLGKWRIIPGSHEVEWLQISMVFISAALTLLSWHFLYHRSEWNIVWGLRPILVALKLVSSGKPEVDAREVRHEGEDSEGS